MATQTKTLVVAGKTFTLSGMLNSSGLEQQLGNVFHILQIQAHDIEGQKQQVELVKQRFSEIDNLQHTVGSLQALVDAAALRISNLEAMQKEDNEKADLLTERVVELEKLMKRTDAVEKRVAEQDKHMAQIQLDFEQLRSDARDALTLASTISFFKTELMELQEDVTKVLHQAPHTERLMHQVQGQLEKSTEQLHSVASKTAVMEGALGKIGVTVDEFKAMRVDILNRLQILENPRVDRMGSVEGIAKALQKQVNLLQQNWMSNWGAHEQSMMLLRQDLMIHIDQLRNKVDMVSGLGGTANMAEGTSLTFVRMDEEERATLQKAIEQHGREISRIDSCKADANLVHGILSEKADHDALETKMDKIAFEERLEALQNLVYLYANDPHARQEGRQRIPAAAHMLISEASVAHRPSTAPDLSQQSSVSFAPSDRENAVTQPLQLKTQQGRRPHSSDADIGREAAVFRHESYEHQRAFQNVINQSRFSSPSGGNRSRPQSTPPTTYLGGMTSDHKSRASNNARSSAAPSDTPATHLTAQRHIILSRNNKLHPALRQPPPLSISPSTNWVPPPGKIRPSTAQTKAGVTPAVHATDLPVRIVSEDASMRAVQGDMAVMGQLPLLDISQQYEEFNEVESGGRGALPTNAPV